MCHIYFVYIYTCYIYNVSKRTRWNSSWNFIGQDGRYTKSPMSGILKKRWGLPSRRPESDV